VNADKAKASFKKGVLRIVLPKTEEARSHTRKQSRFKRVEQTLEVRQDTVNTIKNRTTIVGIVTLILGLAVGLGIGVWSVKNSQARSASGAQVNLSSTALSATAEPSFGKNEWDPFRQMERMQEEIDPAIRSAAKQFELNLGAMVFRSDAGYS